MPIPFVDFQASTPYQKLEVPESGSTLAACSMVASFPSLALQLRKKDCLMQEAEGLVRELWSPRIGITTDTDCALSCAYETAANRRRHL